jgi:hypothetical protein
MAADSFVQGLDVGTMGEIVLAGTQFMGSAGAPTYTIVENPLGGNAIRISNREQNHYAIDLDTSQFEWDVANNAYLITVSGNVLFGGPVIVGGSDSPWTTLFSTEADMGSGDFELTGLINASTLAGAGERGWLRIQVNNTNTFTIHELSIVFYDTAENIAAAVAGDTETSTGPYEFNFTPAEQADGAAFHFAGIEWEDRGPYTQWQWGFRPAAGDQGGDGYVIRGMRVGGEPEDNSYYVAQRNNLTIEFPYPLASGVAYEFSAWIFVPSDDNEGLADGFGNVREGRGTTFAVPSLLVNQTAGSSPHTFQMTEQGRVPLDTWYHITAVLQYHDELIESIAIRFHVNDWQNYPDVWYVDSVTITRQ